MGVGQTPSHPYKLLTASELAPGEIATALTPPSLYVANCLKVDALYASKSRSVSAKIVLPSLEKQTEYKYCV